MTQAATTATKRAPFKVDTSRGSTNGEVSMQWLARPHDQRFLSLDDLFDAKKKFWDGAWQQRANTNDFELYAPEPENPSDFHRISVRGIKVDRGETIDAVEVTPTHWGFQQLCGLAKLPAKLMRELPTQIGKDMFNWRLQHAREVEAVKLYGSTELLYAATGPEYGRIPDYEVADAVREIAGSGRGEMRWKIPGVMNWSDHTYNPEAPVTLDSTTLYASDRDIFMFLVDDRNPIEVGKLQNGDPDLMFRGFFVQNSEMGARSLKIAAFYLRGVCMNRCLWGVEGFEEIKLSHTRMAPSRWVQMARPALTSFAEGSSDKLIAGVQAAKDARIADDDEKALDFLKARSAFSGAQAKNILARGLEEEGRPVRSAWDFAQAITAEARSLPYTDERQAWELEAGRILDKAAGVRSTVTAD